MRIIHLLCSRLRNRWNTSSILGTICWRWNVPGHLPAAEYADNNQWQFSYYTFEQHWLIPSFLSCFFFLLALFFTKFYVLIWSRSIRQRLNLLQLCKCLFSLTKSQMSKCDFFVSFVQFFPLLEHSFFSRISLFSLCISY